MSKPPGMRRDREGPRPTVGFLVDQLVGMYQRAVWLGVADAVREQGANLICFGGGSLRSPYGFEAQENVLFELASAQNVNGLVVMTGAIGNQMGLEEIRSFCYRYRPLPVVSVARHVDGIPSVLVDNDRGMREAMAHLIEDHALRRIAFIRGPAFNEDAERRYLVYREMLESYGIALDPELVVSGNFRVDSGVSATRELLTTRPRSFDALVAANDDMAFGALESLRSQGVRVPEDVAVVGFDDQEGSTVARPALSTVQQPLYQQGRRAAEMVLALVAGEAVAERVVLPTKLVVRRSCGCFSQTVVQAGTGGVASAAGPGPRPPREETRASVVDALDAAVGSTTGDASLRVQRIYDAFAAELQSGGHRPFLTAFDEVLRDAIASDFDVSVWESVISVLRQRLLPGLMSDSVLHARAENLWHMARVLACEIGEQVQAHRRLHGERRAATLREISGALATTFDLQQLMRVLAKELPRLSIGSCFLALYERSAQPTLDARLVLAFDESGQIDLGLEGRPFSSRQLTPEGMLPRDRSFAYVAEPLFFGEERFGFVLLEMGPREGGVFESLRDQMSSALKGALLVRQVMEKDRELEHLLHDLGRRTEQLQQAYTALQENQEKLLVSEKMASLGRLTAGIAHEINTPLAAVRAALSELEKLVSEYKSSLGDPEVTEQDHREIAGDMLRSLTLAGKASERVAGFVRGIKSQTRDLTPRERQRFNAVPVIEEALMLLGHALRQGKCTAEVSTDAGPIELFGSPSRLGQIVTNLVTNAIDATAGTGGPISLGLRRVDGGVALSVTDRGCGIPAENLSRIFDPMFTTKPFGIGTGLGLTIVHDAVSAEFGGSIKVESRPGAGTTFTIRFPSAEKAQADALRAQTQP